MKMKIKGWVEDALARLLWLLCLLVAILPHCIRYGVLSPFIAFILRKILHYRKRIIDLQLRDSFPEKSGEELAEIKSRFYDYLAEMVVGTLSLAGMGDRARRKAIKFDLPSNFNEVVDGKNVVFLTSHYGFWEAILNIYLEMPDHYIVAAYHPLKSSVMDKLFILLRRMERVVLVPSKGLMRYFFNNARKEKPELLGLGLIADQNCPPTRGCCWHRFLNHDTLFFDGGEQLALKFSMPVYYLQLERIKGGHYRMTLEPIYDGKSEIAPHEITECYVRLLEQTIRKKPEHWLWSHNRWKHRPSKEGAKFYNDYKNNEQ